MSTFYFIFIPPETLNRKTMAFYIIILLVAVVVFLQWYTPTGAKEDMQELLYAEHACIICMR